MKNKRLVTLIILLAVLVITWFIVRITGVLQLYSFSSPANEPTIQAGSFVLTSNLQKPKPGDLIAFKTSPYADSISMTGSKGDTWIFRLVATEGENIEMKDGICNVNGKNYDSNKNLLFNYLIDTEVIALIPNRQELEEKQYIRQVSANQYEIFLTSVQIQELNKRRIIPEKVIYRNMNEMMGAFKWINKDSVWTIDNFGPLKVPKGHFFVMGDNRHNALDSRYIGFIKSENFRGVVLNK